MTHKDKELLLKDVSSRLPYGVKICYIYNGEECVSTIEKIDAFGYIWDNYNGCYHVKEIKPYLFPLSSMTEEQKKELRQMDAFVNTFGQICFSTYDDYRHELVPTFEDAIRITNWLNKNHFDYRGLIEKELALDATDLNIY